MTDPHNRHAGGRAATGSPMHYATGIVFCLGWWLLTATSPTFASTVNDVVAAEMKEHHITGISLAIIEHSEIRTVRAYGFTEQSATTPVTTSTLFQAGSISKPVAALGALCLVKDGRLSLDEDVNRWLKQWKVPENEFTKDEKVTVQKANSGLGLGLEGSGKTLRFSHGGRDEGFDAFMLAYAESGQGVVIMINANDNSGAVNRMMDAVRREYHWPDTP